MVFIQFFFVGGNPVVVRHGTTAACLRDPFAAATLDAPLAALTGAGWALDWALVERRANRAADKAAGLGARRARLREDQPEAPAQVVWRRPAGHPG